MYAVFVNGSYERICSTREKAIEVMLQIVKATIRMFGMRGDLTAANVCTALDKEMLHMAQMQFIEESCNLGHEPDLLLHEKYSDIPEIVEYIHMKVGYMP